MREQTPALLIGLSRSSSEISTGNASAWPHVQRRTLAIRLLWLSAHSMDLWKSVGDIRHLEALQKPPHSGQWIALTKRRTYHAVIHKGSCAHTLLEQQQHDLLKTDTVSISIEQLIKCQPSQDFSDYWIDCRPADIPNVVLGNHNPSYFSKSYRQYRLCQAMHGLPSHVQSR